MVNPALPSLPRLPRLPGPRPKLGLKRFLPRTLFGRSLLIIITPVVMLELVATWIFYERHWDNISHRLSSALAGDVAMVIDELSRDETDAEKLKTLRNAAHDMELFITLNRVPGCRSRCPGSMAGCRKLWRKRLISR